MFLNHMQSGPVLPACSVSLGILLWQASPENSPLYPKKGWCLCPSPVDTGCPSHALITTSVPPCGSLYTYFTQQFGFVLSITVSQVL